MKIETIVQDAAVNFADLVPEAKEIMLDAFDKIYEYENTIDLNPNDFTVTDSLDESSTNFGGAFITCTHGSYLVHDLREEQIEWYEGDPNLYTVVFYSLSKITN